jgi:hypothetical protein
VNYCGKGRKGEGRRGGRGGGKWKEGEEGIGIGGEIMGVKVKGKEGKRRKGEAEVW